MLWLMDLLPSPYHTIAVHGGDCVWRGLTMAICDSATNAPEQPRATYGQKKPNLLCTFTQTATYGRTSKSKSKHYECLPAGSRCDADHICGHSTRSSAILSGLPLVLACCCPSCFSSPSRQSWARSQLWCFTSLCASQRTLNNYGWGSIV
jgi:hypothetical protein